MDPYKRILLLVGIGLLLLVPANLLGCGWRIHAIHGDWTGFLATDSWGHARAVLAKHASDPATFEIFGAGDCPYLRLGPHDGQDPFANY